MEKLKCKIVVLLQQPEFHIFMLFLCFALFVRPLLFMYGIARPATVFLSLFLPWGGMVILFFLVSQSYTIGEPDDDSGQAGGEETDV